jgi:hypothetical protein
VELIFSAETNICSSGTRVWTLNKKKIASAAFLDIHGPHVPNVAKSLHHACPAGKPDEFSVCGDFGTAERGA